MFQAFHNESSHQAALRHKRRQRPLVTLSVIYLNPGVQCYTSGRSKSISHISILLYWKHKETNILVDKSCSSFTFILCFMFITYVCAHIYLLNSSAIHRLFIPRDQPESNFQGSLTKAFPQLSGYDRCRLDS